MVTNGLQMGYKWVTNGLQMGDKWATNGSISIKRMNQIIKNIIIPK